MEVTRSKDTLVAFMGVLLSGNYYVPVSREMPEEKVEKIRQQINLAAYLYADHSLVKRLPEADEQDYKKDCTRLWKRYRRRRHCMWYLHLVQPVC